MRKLIRSRELDAELTDIFEYIGHDSVKAAHHFLEAAVRCFQQLARLPDLGASDEFSNPQLLGLRRWRIKEFSSYLVFYRSEIDSIEMLRVIHGARDLDSLFDE